MSKSTTTSSTADVVLPAHTKIGITQQPSNVEMIFDYDCPVYITYKVAVFGMNGIINSGILLTNTLSGICTIFGGETSEDGYTAVDNLYNRAVNKKDIVGFEQTQKTFTHEAGNNRISYIDWANVSQSSPANGFGKISDSVEWLNYNTPISAAGATISLHSTGVKTSITGIEPLYNLDNVRINGMGTYNLAVGGSLDLATVVTQGYNRYNIPYYGYIILNGKWNFCDAQGNILSSVEGASLDYVSGYQVLTAEALGEYYVKYSIYEDTYKNNDGNYIKNSELSSTPIVKVCVTKTGENHTCTAGEWKTTIPATCFIEGEQVQSCSVCGLMMNVRKLEKLAHTPVKVTTPATCTEDGSVSEICGICNTEISDMTVSATDHDDGAWKIDFEATADHDGQMTKYCSICKDALESKTFELHEHSYSSWRTNNDGTHSRDCYKCGFTESANCNYVKTVTAPTCTEGGHTTNVCSDCGHTYIDAYTAALGHNWGEWKECDEGCCHERECERNGCNAVESQAHSWSEWVYNEDGTFFKNGTKTRNCPDCGATETEEAHHTSWICQVFYPVIVFFGNIVHKIIYLISLNWLFPELTITPKI